MKPHNQNMVWSDTSVYVCQGEASHVMQARVPGTEKLFFILVYLLRNIYEVM